VGDNCIIGMGAIVLDGAVIPPNCIVGAGSLVMPRKTYRAHGIGGRRASGLPSVRDHPVP
jgi:carbonic anhydrase/acetyltransferase-like protein (isoleucine patch superfamily)